jgi:hypothetical protein
MMPSHSNTTLRTLHPPVRSSAVAASPSGKFEMTTAINIATLIPPSRTVKPRTIDSGIPSRTMPSTSASATALEVMVAFTAAGPAATAVGVCIRSINASPT